MTPLLDASKKPFVFVISDEVMELIHRTDRDASGQIAIPDLVTNPATRNRYLIGSLIEEAITSSQLEGAATTGKVAKEMIRSGRKPVNRSEQMVLNNYLAMRNIREHIGEPLTPERVLELHRVVTKGTLEDDSAVGRLRTRADDVVVSDDQGNVLHTPVDAEGLEQRMQAFCSFANALNDKRFIHPILRSIVLHFWMGYDHPFVDGNGRTARAIFYWSMLSRGYWLFEFVSISQTLRAAPSKYARSFLFTETDEDNDLTYFLLYHLRVIRRAIAELHKYLERKIAEVQQVERLLRHSAALNHRQIGLLINALKNSDARYSFKSHQTSNGVAYQTARTDLLGLADRGFLEVRKVGRAYQFWPPEDIGERLRRLNAECEGPR